MINDRTPKVYLSRRNLMALLSKLDRQHDGEETHCTIIKQRQLSQSAYNQTMSTIAVIAVEDDVYYGERPAGEMHPSDEIKLNKPASGTEFAGPIL